MDTLKKLRHQKNIRQIDVATALGIARTTYAMYESGQRTPDKEMLIKLADFFAVSVDYLIGYVSIPPQMSQLNEIGLLDWYKKLPEAAPEDLQKLKDIWEIIKKDENS
ncbi:helix-turn-helix domain-containing protein [Brochothrix campestris]|uniref:Transcriptional regulator n=1 Tax=Brochothrix campestris FSL F6-1037 TaxID=1265861 RepID=W7CQM9_9LIST|nr:helix-turn-helix transcriptional regulator [Brochothrix campestris]EUJ41939.1 transcriptional regulator [Brochothrix campestris FSL F6-1037]